jgi:hypothetical protein
MVKNINWSRKRAPHQNWEDLTDNPEHQTTVGGKTSIGNATAELVAEAAGLSAPHKPRYSQSAFHPPLAFHQADKSPFNTCKALRKHIYSHMITNQYDPWQDSNTQEDDLQRRFDPSNTHEFVSKGLKGILTGGITKPSYTPKQRCHTVSTANTYANHTRQNH